MGDGVAGDADPEGPRGGVGKGDVLDVVPAVGAPGVSIGQLRVAKDAPRVWALGPQVQIVDQRAGGSRRGGVVLPHEMNGERGVSLRGALGGAEVKAAGADRVGLCRVVVGVKQQLERRGLAQRDGLVERERAKPGVVVDRGRDLCPRVAAAPVEPALQLCGARQEQRLEQRGRGENGPGLGRLSVWPPPFHQVLAEEEGRACGRRGGHRGPGLGHQPGFAIVARVGRGGRVAVRAGGPDVVSGGDEVWLEPLVWPGGAKGRVAGHVLGSVRLGPGLELAQHGWRAGGGDLIVDDAALVLKAKVGRVLGPD